MTEPFTILMCKNVVDEVIDTVNDFGIACTSFPFALGGETKEPTVRDWADEDGEDAYIPQTGLKIKAYDLEAEMCYKGDPGSAYQNVMAFRDYMTGADGDGAQLRIYNPHTGIGRKDCFLKDFGDPEFYTDSSGDVLTFKLKIRVTDPITSIVPIVSGNRMSLIARD